MSSSNIFRNRLSLLVVSLIINHFLVSWSAAGFFLGQNPGLDHFLRGRRSRSDSSHRCSVQANRDPLAATRESARPCNVTRLPAGSRETTVATSFALHWNLGNLRRAVRELRSLYESRVNLTYPHPGGLINVTGVPLESREGSRTRNQRPFHRIADDLRRFYVSINEAEQHEIGLRDHRLNTLERRLCFVRGHLNNVLCTLHAALEETVHVDIEALVRLVRQLAQMRSEHHEGALDVWVYLLFQDLENYLQKMQDFVESISEVRK